MLEDVVSVFQIFKMALWVREEMNGYFRLGVKERLYLGGDIFKLGFDWIQFCDGRYLKLVLRF